jgi:acyl-CoA synthetase (AMP-forming)/AMP-acid ligase II
LLLCFIRVRKKELVPHVQVNDAANELAEHLTAAGFTDGAYVAVLLPRGFELVVSVMAIWKAGACYVPMDPDFPPERLAIYVSVGCSSAGCIITASQQHGYGRASSPADCSSDSAIAVMALAITTSQPYAQKDTCTVLFPSMAALDSSSI